MISNNCEGIRDPPKPVILKYPNGEILKGEVIREVRKAWNHPDFGDYCAVIQLIAYPRDNLENTIRFAYYKWNEDKGHYIWINRPYEFGIEFTKELIQKAEEAGIF